MNDGEKCDAPASLETFVERFAANVTRLAELVQALRVLDGRVDAYLYGATPGKEAVDDGNRITPSLASVSGDLEVQLADFDKLITSLARHVSLEGKSQ